MAHHLVGMAEVAEMLGVSRQRVAQIIGSYADFPAPEVELAGGRVWSRTAVETWIAAHPERSGKEAAEGQASAGGLFGRFTPDARGVVVLAQEQARLLCHNYIGTEHFLLALAAGATRVRNVLEGLGVSLEAARDMVVEMIGRGSETPTGHIPFTPRAKKVLEFSLREALRVGANVIRPEHILLALIEEGKGVAPQALLKLGLDLGDVRRAVLESLVAEMPLWGPGLSWTWRPGIPPPGEPGRTEARRDALTCSFCSKSEKSVKKLIAGPGVYICDDCVELCNKIIGEELSGPPARSGVDPNLHASLRDEIRTLEARLQALEQRDPGAPEGREPGE